MSLGPLSVFGTAINLDGGSFGENFESIPPPRTAAAHAPTLAKPKSASGNTVESFSGQLGKSYLN
jgi:hypothetical protein